MWNSTKMVLKRVSRAPRYTKIDNNVDDRMPEYNLLAIGRCMLTLTPRIETIPKRLQRTRVFIRNVGTCIFVPDLRLANLHVRLVRIFTAFLHTGGREQLWTSGRYRVGCHNEDASIRVFVDDACFSDRVQFSSKHTWENYIIRELKTWLFVYSIGVLKVIIIS